MTLTTKEFIRNSVLRIDDMQRIPKGMLSSSR